MDERINEHLRQLEKLLRDADDAVSKSTLHNRKRVTKQRNAINAACNALYRASVA